MVPDWTPAPLEEPQAKLERVLIEEYLSARGEHYVALQARSDPAARELLTQAATYAAMKLAEVEARAHYVHDLHHSSETG